MSIVASDARKSIEVAEVQGGFILSLQGERKTWETYVCVTVEEMASVVVRFFQGDITLMDYNPSRHENPRTIDTPYFGSPAGAKDNA